MKLIKIQYKFQDVKVESRIDKTNDGDRKLNLHCDCEMQHGNVIFIFFI